MLCASKRAIFLRSAFLRCLWVCLTLAIVGLARGHHRWMGVYPRRWHIRPNLVCVGAKLGARDLTVGGRYTELGMQMNERIVGDKAETALPARVQDLRHSALRDADSPGDLRLCHPRIQKITDQ